MGLEKKQLITKWPSCEDVRNGSIDAEYVREDRLQWPGRFHILDGKVVFDYCDSGVSIEQSTWRGVPFLFHKTNTF